MANVLVTGGAGFIGSHLARRLVRLGHRVRVLDDFSTGRRDNLAPIADDIELIEGDICDQLVCRESSEGIDFLFHQAAVPSVPKSIESPRASHEANVTGTFNLLQSAVEQGVRRFIYAGSSSAYGDTKESPKHERLTPAPLSPYAVQKLAGEHYARAFCECFGLETISLRYFNVFGPGQDPSSQYAAAIPAFVSAMLRGERPTVFGDGTQTRDFTYIDNVVHGNLLAMTAPKTMGESVNVACGGSVSIKRVIRTLNSLLGTDIKPLYVERRPGDVLHSCADIGLARTLLGFEPQVSFEDGLRRAIDYYKSLCRDR